MYLHRRVDWQPTSENKSGCVVSINLTAYIRELCCLLFFYTKKMRNLDRDRGREKPKEKKSGFKIYLQKRINQLRTYAQLLQLGAIKTCFINQKKWYRWLSGYGEYIIAKVIYKAFRTSSRRKKCFSGHPLIYDVPQHFGGRHTGLVSSMLHCDKYIQRSQGRIKGSWCD